MTRQMYPDSQKEPPGPNQREWIDRKYGKAFFRDARPMVKHCVCQLPEPTRKSP